MRGLARYFYIVLLFSGLVVGLSSRSWASVKVWEGTLTIPTYGWAEDINPKLWALEGDVKF